MDISIEEISKGAPFMVNFNKVVVERCHYINAVEESVEKLAFLSQAKATMLRVINNGTIFIQIINWGIERTLVQFRAYPFFYHKNEFAELAQCTKVRGNEIIEEIPVCFEELEHGKVNLFSVSKQKGETIACLILNPQETEDYYYRILFREG